MSFKVHPSIRKLFHPNRFTLFRNQWDRVVVADKLPIEYQKFYTEWMDSQEKETPIHWKPPQEKWWRNPETGAIKIIPDEPIHVNYPIEMNNGLWGGEGVIQGCVKKGKWRTPVPRFWSPTLKKSIVYSEILDTYLSVVVTERALRLIDKHHGLDDYIITTPAYDLKSLLALKLKKMMITAILDKNFCKEDPTRQAQISEKYKDYLLPRNELEWYGLSVDEALEKAKQLEEIRRIPVPLKLRFRSELLEQLHESRLKAAAEANENEGKSKQLSESWSTKLNPFAKTK